MCNCRAKKAAVAPAAAAGPRSRVLPAPPPPPQPPKQTRLVTKTITIRQVSRLPVRSGGRSGGGKVQQKTVTQELPLEIVNTAVWGPHVWRIIHTATLRLPTGLSSDSLPTDLDGALPCPDCAAHFHRWVQTHPYPAAAPAADDVSGSSGPSGPANGAATWWLDLHNDVNRRRGVAPWTMEQLVTASAGVDLASLEASFATIRGLLGSRGVAALRRLLDALESSG